MKKLDKVGSLQKFYSIIITLAIISILVFAVPANALDVKLSSPSSEKVTKGDKVSFTASLNIKSNEQVPFDDMQLLIENQLCKFKVDGTPISGCNGVKIDLIKFESDYLESNNTFKFKGHKYDYGYGYGYSDSQGGSADIEYKITIDTHNLSPGKYDVLFKARVGSNRFASSSHQFEVKVPKTITTVRINAGGDTFTDVYGKYWSKDKLYNTGTSYEVSSPITNTDNDYLYQTERIDYPSSPELKYSIPVPDGDYEVSLYFAETQKDKFKNGKRVFDVYINNDRKLHNLDIYRQVGPNKVLKKNINVHVSNGQIDIEFKHKTSNPVISAIEIVKK